MTNVKYLVAIIAVAVAILIWTQSGLRTPKGFIRNGDWVVSCQSGIDIRYHNWSERFSLRYIPLAPDGHTTLNISSQTYARYLRFGKIVLADSTYGYEKYLGKNALSDNTETLNERHVLPILNELLNNPKIEYFSLQVVDSEIDSRWLDHMTVSTNGLADSIDYVEWCLK